MIMVTNYWAVSAPEVEWFGAISGEIYAAALCKCSKGSRWGLSGTFDQILVQIWGWWEWCQTESGVLSWPNLVHQWTPLPPLLQLLHCILSLHCAINLISIHCKALDCTAILLLTIYICIGLNCIASEACRNCGTASLSEFSVLKKASCRVGNRMVLGHL